MSAGDVIGNVLLGGGHGRTYTPAEQAAYSAQYPSLVWRDGVPYTYAPADTSGDPDSPNPQYRPQDTSDQLVEADLSDPNFLGQLGRFAAITSGGKFLAEGGLGGWSTPGAGASSSASSAAAPMTSAAAIPGSTGMGTTSFLGTLGKFGNVLQNVAPVFKNMAGYSADAQAERAAAESQRNSQLLSQYGIQQGAQMNAGQLDLQRQQYAEQSQAQQMKRALIAALMGNMTDVNVSVPGIPQATVSGGLRPSLLNKDILGQMQSTAMTNATTPKTWQGGELLTPPTIAPVGQTGGNTFLNFLAAITGLGGALNATSSRSRRPSVMQGDVFHQPEAVA